MKNTFFKALRKLKDVAYEHYKGFYNFNRDKYPKTFLAYTHKSEKLVKRKDIKEVVYCFWTGDNEITENRKRCLDEMKEKIGYPIVLITKDNLANYILPEHPLHKAYDFLSAVHKSDYLRAYFMHHYGGGTAILKPR
ncbi:MAG: capsular polysaccharide synthesis protein [Flavobacteriaceae bacterium]|nr:capsular polysaccharide synthesis protein [Flavobacteriaceae bacterium]